MKIREIININDRRSWIKKDKSLEISKRKKKKNEKKKNISVKIQVVLNILMHVYEHYEHRVNEKNV